MAYRDPWTVDFTSWLADMVYNDHAPAEVSSGDHVLALPLWTWVSPGVDMGAKSITPTGEALHVPVRLVWDEGPVRLLQPGQMMTTTARARGLGYTGSATVCISLAGEGGKCYLNVTEKRKRDTKVWGITPDLVGRGREVVSQLASAARESEWKARMSLEFYIQRAVDRAVRVVTADVIRTSNTTGPGPRVIDATAADQVADEMMLGTPQDRGAVARLLHRCMKPEAFTSVDPVRYVRSDLERTAVSYVRRKIGDPHVGSLIRRLHRDMPAASIDELIEAYNSRHPGDNVGLRRATRALTVGRDANAHTVPFDEYASYRRAAS